MMYVEILYYENRELVSDASQLLKNKVIFS